MKTKYFIILVILFVTVNLVVIQLHLLLFKTSTPFVGMITALIHLIGLALIPYKTIINKIK